MLKNVKGLFVNSAAGRCSIHESGLDIHEVLTHPDVDSFAFDYIDPDPRLIKAMAIRNSIRGVSYDYVVIQYHQTTNAELSRDSFGVPTIAFAMEAMPKPPYVYELKGEWDAVCVPDPTLARKISGGGTLHSFPRPIVDYRPMPHSGLLETSEDRYPYEPLRVGFHGFPTVGKPLRPLFKQIGREFKSFTLTVRMPSFTFGAGTAGDKTREMAAEVAELQRRARMMSARNRDVVVIHKTDYLPRHELLAWCASQDLLCYHYERDLSGIAATIDEAVAAGTPVSVSGCDTFRHVHEYQRPYPFTSLKDALASDAVSRMREAWHPDRFRAKFKEVLSSVL